MKKKIQEILKTVKGGWRNKSINKISALDSITDKEVIEEKQTKEMENILNKKKNKETKR